MSLNIDHLLSNEAEYDGIPGPSDPLEKPVTHLAGEGLVVSQTGGTVQYSLDEEFIQGLQEAAAEIAAHNFGFKVTATKLDTPEPKARVEIAAGIINDSTWTAGLGWHHREQEIPAGVLNEVELPALIYGVVRLKSVQSTGLPDGVFTGLAAIDGRNYQIYTRTGTATKCVDETVLPEESEDEQESIFQWEENPVVPAGDYFQFRVAQIDEAGLVSWQYAIGSVTVPQAFEPVVLEFEMF